MPLIFRVLSTDDEIRSAYPLLSALRARLREDRVIVEVRRQQRDGYELIGAFDGDTLVSLAGVRPGHTLSRGEHVFVDDLVTDEAHQGRGHARAILAWVAARTAAVGIDRVYLDSRDTARGFYADVGFHFLTSVPCWIESDRLSR